jgi:hypothetical protein
MNVSAAVSGGTPPPVASCTSIWHVVEKKVPNVVEVPTSVHVLAVLRLLHRVVICRRVSNWGLMWMLVKYITASHVIDRQIITTSSKGTQKLTNKSYSGAMLWACSYVN